MDWGFINILKKAEFNSLMLSIAIAGWIMNIWIIPNNAYIVGTAIMASVYCIIRFVVYCYNYIVHKREQEMTETIQSEIRQQEEEERNNEINRMFFGLSEENKKNLAIIFLKGKKDPINNNVLHFQKFGEDSFRANTAQEATSIFRDEFGNRMPCITQKIYTDTIAVVIDPYLYDLIKKYVEDNQLC